MGRNLYGCGSGRQAESCQLSAIQGLSHWSPHHRKLMCSQNRREYSPCRLWQKRRVFDSFASTSTCDDAQAVDGAVTVVCFK